MPALVWIGLCILGVHIVVAFFIIRFLQKSYNLLEERSNELNSHIIPAALGMKEASAHMNRIGNRFSTAMQVLTEP